MEKSDSGTSKPVVSSTKCQKLVSAFRIMAKSLAILVLILCVLSHFNISESFHKAQSIRHAPPPKRFFPIHNYVVDFPLGQLQPVVNLLQEEELIFLMYYAPWCAESMSVRDEFMKAARVFHQTVKFVAVNCWYTEGECRKTVKIFGYPDLYVYHVGIDEGYRFTGPKKAELFVRFVESFLYPIHPLYSERQIQEFIAKQDNTVIGYFDFNSSPQPPGSAFHQFYLAALRVISYDFYQPIKFGIVLVRHLAEFFDIKSPDRFVMARTGNVTLKYPLFYNMTCKNITNWVLYFKQQNAAKWLVPPGIKSLTLSSALKRGPAVILLGPSNPMHEFNPYFEMVRLASLQYNTCGNNSGTIRTAAKYSIIHTILHLNKLRQQTEKCRQASGTCAAENFETLSSKCCVSFLSGARTSGSVCEYCVEKSVSDGDTLCDMEWETWRKSELYSAQINTCLHSYQNYNVNEHHSLSCKEGMPGIVDSYILNNDGKNGRRVTDPYIINGVQSALKNQCNKSGLQKIKKLIHYENLTKVITKLSDLEGNKFISGLACLTNKTVNYYFADSSYHSLFLERLGISVQSQPNRATVILVDGGNEASYLLREEVNYANLVKFISNYTEGILSRHQRSETVSSPTGCDPESTNVCVVDVSMETFNSVVFDNKKDVMLLYYTPWCGFCSHFAHTFLAAAKYFSPYGNITFARINAEVNDLPWELSVDEYPTVIMFPANRKAESIKFPDDVQKSLPNIIKFVLYYSKHRLQMESASTICSRNCADRNKKLVVEEIGRLRKLLNRLLRRLTTLSQQYTFDHPYFTFARDTLRRLYDLRHDKLRKAQSLQYVLDNDLKQLVRIKL